MHASTALDFNSDSHTYTCYGIWDTAHIAYIQKQIARLPVHSTENAVINTQNIIKLDSAGAWLLNKFIQKLEHKNIKVTLEGLTPEQKTILKIISAYPISQHLPEYKPDSQLALLGRHTVNTVKQGLRFCSFLGEITLTFWQVLTQPKRLRLQPILGTLQSGGYQALPIIGLLSFLIGIVLAYQMGVQLRSYGANVYIVNFLGLAVLREFAPLMTAIIIAGRTGSAFTAQIGTMKINQEIAALQTMGINPNELLIVPKTIGMLIALPLLTVWAMLFGVLGGMVMANGMLGINYVDFLGRFAEVISVKHYFVGMVKTPVFAVLISLIGCYQGLQVTGSADSVGKQTTKSVVQAIFFIIVADAGFSIMFNWLKI